MKSKIPLFIFGLCFCSFISCSTKHIASKAMNKIGKTQNALVLRTDFSDDPKWKQVCTEIETPEPIENFKAYVTFLSDSQYEGISTEKVISLIKQ